MNLKKKILLGVGLLLLVVVIGVPAFLMFRGISQFGSAKDELSMTVNSLRSFYKKNPFPTKANIEKEKENLDQMLKWFGELVDVVTAGQIEQIYTTPTSFMTQYNDMRNKIEDLANPTKGIEVLTPDDALGFTRYASGILPVAVDVPRLMQQMRITERLATILIDAKVKKINKMTREEFDNSKAVSPRLASSRRSGGRRNASSTPIARPTNGMKAIRKTDVYEAQSFSVEFLAKEDVALDVINRFARDDLFIVVTGIEFNKESKDLKMPQSEVAKNVVTTDDGLADITGGDERT